MAKVNGSSASAVSFVQVQTLRGNAGIDAAFATVEAAVKTYNAQQPKGGTPHIAVKVTALPNNVKGMQWQLALLATLARANGANMVRLNVHNGAVALCGTAAAVKAVQAAMVPATNEYATAVANAYNPATHGNRVGFTNGYLCGCPAGLQTALGITATLAYGIGFLFSFPAPGDGKAYAVGHAAAAATAKAVKAPKAPKAPKAVTTTAEQAPATADVPALPEVVAA